MKEFKPRAMKRTLGEENTVQFWGRGRVVVCGYVADTVHSSTFQDDAGETSKAGVRPSTPVRC